jgi:hypothetical protein
MTNLKVLISATGLALLVSSPVLAANHNRHQAPVAHTTNVVVAPNGQVIGADPDAQIRSEMLRDWPTSAGANGG